MLTLNEIRNVNFRKSNFGGYRAEDVEAFIDEVQLSYDSLLKENAELLKRLESLTTKLEEYQREEDSIRNALMNAQKVGDASLRDAKHKAEIILKDATIKAEKIVSNAQIEIHRERDVIEKMQRDIADFKARLLKAYKEHLTLISLSGFQKGLSAGRFFLFSVCRPPKRRPIRPQKRFCHAG